jgi:hypothetical protein
MKIKILATDKLRNTDEKERREEEKKKILGVSWCLGALVAKFSLSWATTPS